MDDVTYKRTIDHFQRSYANVQENIRFVDAKVAGAMGVVVVVLGFAISRGVIVQQLKAWVEKSTVWGWIEGGLFVAVAGALVAVIWFVKETLYPRLNKNPLLEDKLWILFPLLAKKRGEVVLHNQLKEMAQAGLKKERIIEEYADQLAVVGAIQSKKMTNCDRLFIAVALFSVFVLALGIVSFLQCIFG